MGFPHPDYLLPLLSADQVTDWQAYEAQTGPLGHARHDLLWGMLMSITANLWGAHTEVSDFLPYHDPFEQEWGEADLQRQLAGIVKPGGVRLPS